MKQELNNMIEFSCNHKFCILLVQKDLCWSNNIAIRLILYDDLWWWKLQLADWYFRPLTDYDFQPIMAKSNHNEWCSIYWKNMRSVMYLTRKRPRGLDTEQPNTTCGGGVVERVLHSVVVHCDIRKALPHVILIT